ncbi:44010_t:CDS:2, partial [Gigaspora margarita]
LHKHWHKWIANSGNDLTKAFKKCGILNCLSGSEDHLIYNDGEEDKEDRTSEDNNSDEDAVESDDYESDKGEYDEGESNERESNKGESDEDGNTNKYNKWPECYVVIN